MRIIILCLSVAAVFLLVSGCSTAATGKSGRTPVIVERVVDGDTVEIKLQGTQRTVRLIGIDTPETKKPGTPVKFYGPQASEYSKKRLAGNEVELEWDTERTDKYGRDLAYVWIGPELFNETLVKEGYARISTFPPNVKYVDRFTRAQKQARQNGKGLWQDYEKAFDTPAK
jgi:micrococcal nuclease